MHGTGTPSVGGPGVPDPQRPARDPTRTTPENQAATFRSLDRAWPHRAIRRGEKVRPLPPHARSLADLTFEVGGVRLGVGDYMARRRTAGLLILKDGEIALERYGMGNGPESRWTSFSTAKSLTSTLCGAALHAGAIAGLDERCERYLPRLRGSAYEGVTVRNVLRMCSGVAWNEQDDGRSGPAAWRGPGAPAAGRRPRAAVPPAARPAAGCRLQLFDRRELLLGALVAAARRYGSDPPTGFASVISSSQESGGLPDRRPRSNGA